MQSPIRIAVQHVTRRLGLAVVIVATLGAGASLALVGGLFSLASAQTTTSGDLTQLHQDLTELNNKLARAIKQLEAEREPGHKFIPITDPGHWLRTLTDLEHVKLSVVGQFPDVFGVPYSETFTNLSCIDEAIAVGKYRMRAQESGLINEVSGGNVLLEVLKNAKDCKDLLELLVPAPATTTTTTTPPEVSIYNPPSYPEYLGVRSITAGAGPTGQMVRRRSTVAGGYLWAVEANTSKILRVATNGSMVEFPLPAGASPLGITTAPDGTVWFTEAGIDSLGQITSSSGTIVQHPLPALEGGELRGLLGIAPGPGGIWFTEYNTNAIGVYNISTGQVSEYPIPVTGSFEGMSEPTSYPWGITEGSDGNMWFTMDYTSEIGRITPSGQISLFPLPTDEVGTGITSGPDQNLWIAIDPTTSGGPGGAGRMTTSGAFTLFSEPGASPTGIAVGPDGRIWYADSGNTANVTAVGTGGKMTEYTQGIPAGSVPRAITTGPDGRVWFTLGGSNQIGAITMPQTVTISEQDTWTWSRSIGKGNICIDVATAPPQASISATLTGPGYHSTLAKTPLPASGGGQVTSEITQGGAYTKTLVVYDTGGNPTGTATNTFMVASSPQNGPAATPPCPAPAH